ncbi:MAG TPA: adaptor protein MecA [Clostridia bacterium]
MKFERISENKIRVTIPIRDLEERNIDINSLNYNSPAAQELIWDMMEQAELQFGFNTSDSQLAIETIPDSIDGCVVNITKLDDDSDFESIQKYIKNRFRKSDLRSKRKSRKVSSTVMIYSLDSFEDLCALATKLSDIYLGESTLYKCRETYYMVLVRNTYTDSNSRIFECILGEYARKVGNVAFFEGYLNEYGTKIAEGNAIEVINSYFS